MRTPNTRPERGYTIIEILIAVLISAIGFAAIFSLQLSTLQGNVAAREMSSAVNLGERYVEQLRVEAFKWTQKAPPAPRLNKTGWQTLTPNPVDRNGFANIDVDADGSPLARQRFCVHYWLDPLQGSYEGILNGRVRVIWSRAAQDLTGLDTICAQAGAAAWEPAVRKWFSVTIPTTLRRHPG